MPPAFTFVSVIFPVHGECFDVRLLRVSHHSEPAKQVDKRRCEPAEGSSIKSHRQGRVTCHVTRDDSAHRGQRGRRARVMRPNNDFILAVNTHDYGRRFFNSHLLCWSEQGKCGAGRSRYLPGLRRD